MNVFFKNSEWVIAKILMDNIEEKLVLAKVVNHKAIGYYDTIGSVTHNNINIYYKLEFISFVENEDVQKYGKPIIPTFNMPQHMLKKYYDKEACIPFSVLMHNLKNNIGNAIWKMKKT